MNREFYTKARILFVLNQCPICRVWLQFIGDLNVNLPIEKQIEVIEVSDYYDWGIINNPKLSAFKKFLTHSYPVLFFDGMRMDMSATRDELEAFIRTLVIEEAKIKYHLSYLTKPDCTIKKFAIFGERLECTNI